MKKKAIIPAKAKRVFKGFIFDVYQWQQKMFDGSYEKYERLTKTDVVEIIAVTKDKKIIVLEQKQPDSEWFLSLPGGKVDKGETPKNTAKRELMEEAGYFAEKIMPRKIYYLSSKIKFKVHSYIAKDCQKKGPSRPDAGEKIKIKLYSFEKFLKLSDSDDFVHRELAIHLLRARLHKKVRDKFYKELFNN